MPLGTCDIDALLKLTTDSDKLEGTLQVAPIGSNKGLNEEAVTAYLSGLGVESKAIQDQAIVNLLAEVRDAPLESHSAVVAVGTTAVHGDSVHYTLIPEVADQVDRIQTRLEAIKSGALTDDQSTNPADLSDGDLDIKGDLTDTAPTDPVSHYDQMSFVIVQKGDLIATKSERGHGFDGANIFGKVIPAKEGKLNESMVDDTIKVCKDGRCTAAFSGVLNASQSKISISQILEIPGDVDFTTGRIQFPGAVMVKGSVRDQFRIVAEGAITVNGLVECAALESKQDIVLTRGMAGKDQGMIRTDQSLDAGYLEGVHAHVKGNAIVQREITNSMVCLLGELDAPRAAVRGGVIHAARGAKIGSAGSVQGVDTELVIGSVPEIEDRLRSIDSFLEQLDKHHKTSLKKLETFSNAISKPTASQIEEQMGMQFEVDEFESRINLLTLSQRNLGLLMTECSDARIHFMKAVYPKVVLYLPGYKVEFTNELLGETLIELGPTGRPSITHRGKTGDLKDLARVVPDDRVLRVGADEPAEDIAA